MADAKTEGFDPVVAAGIAGMILHATADTLAPDDDAVAGAMANLAALAMLPLDMAAGVLLATTSLIGTVQISEPELRDIAARYTAEAEREATT